jgi:hypothetical protein
MANPNKIHTHGLTDETIAGLPDNELNAMHIIIERNTEAIRKLKAANKEKEDILKRRMELDRQTQQIKLLEEKFATVKELAIQKIKEGMSAEEAVNDSDFTIERHEYMMGVDPARPDTGILLDPFTFEPRRVQRDRNGVVIRMEDHRNQVWRDAFDHILVDFDDYRNTDI